MVDIQDVILGAPEKTVIKMPMADCPYMCLAIIDDKKRHGSHQHVGGFKMPGFREVEKHFDDEKIKNTPKATTTIKPESNISLDDAKNSLTSCF